MKIRRARSHEADTITALVMRSKRSNGYDEAFMEACREELRVTPDLLKAREVWIAEDTVICGCASLVVETDRKTAEVGLFFVDPDCKRQGVGQRLWERLLSRSRELGLQMLHLDADPSAVPFYEKQGFRTVGQTPSGSIPGRTIPYMELRLA